MFFQVHPALHLVHAKNGAQNLKGVTNLFFASLALGLQLSKRRRRVPRQRGPMGEAGHGEVTELLLAWSGGEASAFDKVMELVYAELHRLARRHSKKNSFHGVWLNRVRTGSRVRSR
jgi:hypothetical protein